MAKQRCETSVGAETDLASIKGAAKAAILLISLDKDTSAAILRQLDQDTIEALTREIAQMGTIDAKIRSAIVEEFYNLALAHQYVEAGGLLYARGLLERALSPDQAIRILKSIEHQVYRQPFSFLAKTDVENLTTFIQDEHPQTIALVLSHLPATRAAEVLANLPTSKQLEVVTRVANMDNTSPEIVKEVEKGLEMRLSGLMEQTFQKCGGVESVAAILNLADRGTEKSILEALEVEDPDLVDQIRRLMFVFEDILLVNDKGIQSVLKEIENEDLALALKTATPELKEKIFRNMSERASQMIKEDMEFMGPVRISDVEGAQQRIVDVVRRLEDAGEIIVSGRGGEKEMIV
jgi:flagellar motor switch protein FliG